VIICDTSALVAVYGRVQPVQGKAERVLRDDPGPLILSPFVLAELDYMVNRDSGVGGELKVLADVAAGVYSLAEFSRADVAQAAGVVERYSDLRIGLADASIVVLAARYGTTRVLTLDERHFRAMRPLHADAFTILPADA
jgi:predicted nucleic acid-binding protein